jgi:iron(III) transport system substrate-binding protein
MSTNRLANSTYEEVEVFHNKWFSVALCVMVIVLIAVACAPAPEPTKAPPPPPPPTTAPAVEPTKAPVAATSAPAATAAPKPTEAAKPTVAPTTAAKDPYKGITAAQDAWAKAAQVGPYAPATADWAAIEAAAKKEGKVAVYSNSSRIADVKKSFETAYPGITVDGYDISTVDLATKLKKEFQAGIYTADVAFTGDSPTQLNEMLYPPSKILWTWVPDVLFDNAKTDQVIDLADRDPLLIHHYSVAVWIYNTEAHKEPPLKNIWDLTKPEWKGRATLNDPQTDAGSLNCFTTFTNHPDEMAKAYEAAFGKPIKLDAGVPNAGYQWVKDFAKNDPVMTKSGGDVATNVGTKGQKNPPLGTASWSKIRGVLSGQLAFDVMWGMAPVVGCYDYVTVSMVNQATHPNAAKLMIRWYMGNQKGELGYAPYFLPGDPTPRKDMAVPQGGKSPADTGKITWRNEPTYVYDNAIKVRDFWMANLSK